MALNVLNDASMEPATQAEWSASTGGLTRPFHWGKSDRSSRSSPRSNPGTRVFLPENTTFLPDMAVTVPNRLRHNTPNTRTVKQSLQRTSIVATEINNIPIRKRKPPFSTTPQLNPHSRMPQHHPINNHHRRRIPLPGIHTQPRRPPLHPRTTTHLQPIRVRHKQPRHQKRLKRNLRHRLPRPGRRRREKASVDYKEGLTLGLDG